tara:strand:+ start:276 stop:839 length:564 start_codon:yes stop_codon:yes gene_type:complete
MMPSRLAPHRAAPALASADDRLAMVTLATDDHPHLQPCNLELKTSGPSYTAVTLGQLREQGYRPSELFFILGADAFLEIETWYDYPGILDSANFVVVSRPGYQASALINALPAIENRIELISIDTKLSHLKTKTHPVVFMIEAITPAISSTDIRTRALLGKPLDGLLPSSVVRYIERHHLYDTDGRQ